MDTRTPGSERVWDPAGVVAAATQEAFAAGSIERCLSRDLRSILEERFWRPVEEHSTLEAVSGDGWVMSEPGLHPALYSDHGIVHARDVADGVVDLADTAAGRLLPLRPDDRQEFVLALAVLLAYIHDAGMHDPTPEGRRVHALHAAQIPFSGAMDDVIDQLWAAAARSRFASPRSAPSHRSASRTTSSCGSSPRSPWVTASRPCPPLCTPTRARFAGCCSGPSSSSSRIIAAVGRT